MATAAKAPNTKAHDPITPGEILLTEFLEPLGITQYRLAQATDHRVVLRHHHQAQASS